MRTRNEHRAVSRGKTVGMVALCLLAVAAVSAATDDHGNTYGTATPIVVGAPAAGDIETGGDMDYFKVPLVNGKRYDIRVTLNTLSDSKVWLFSTNGTTMLGYNDNESLTNLGSLITFDCTATGDYYVKVAAATALKTGTYSLLVTDKGAWAYTASGAVTGAGADGTVITFTRVSGGGVLPTAATVSGGLWTKSGFQPGTTYRATPSKNGISFAPSYRDFNATASDLNFAAYTDDAGNTYQTAKAITLGLPTGGTIEVGTDVDYFKVTMTIGRTYEILVSLDGKTLADSKLWLYGTNGTTQVGYNDDDPLGGSGSRLSYNCLATGTYYMKVGPYSTAINGTYSITVTDKGIWTYAAGGLATLYGQTDHSGVKITFTRVSGSGSVPTAVTSNASGAWTQTGFSMGTKYRATPSKAGWVFTPAYLDFSAATTSLKFYGDDHGNAASAATPVTVGSTTNGNIEIWTDTDIFKVNLTRGKRYEFYVDLSGGTLFDSRLWFNATNGVTVLAYNDNDPLGGSDSRITYDLWLASGTYYLVVKGANNTASRGTYKVQVTDKGPALFKASGKVTLYGQAIHSGVTLTFDRISGTGAIPGPAFTADAGTWSQTGFAQETVYRVTPSKPGWKFNPVSRQFSLASGSGLTTLNFTADDQSNFMADANAVLWGSNVPAKIEVGGDVDFFGLTMANGKRYDIQTALPVLPDSQMWLYKANGTQVGYNNDAAVGNRASRIVYDCVEDGIYYVKVAALSTAQSGDYILNLSTPVVDWGFTAGGNVSTNPGLQYVTIAFSMVAGGGALPAPSTQTDVNGNWTQDKFRKGTTYRATPSLAGYIFDPLSRDFTDAPPPADPNATGLNFTAYDTTEDDYANAKDGVVPPVGDLDLGVAKNGVIELGTDVDFFKIALEAGWYNIRVTLGTLPDSKAWLYNDAGSELAYNDDASASDPSSWIAFNCTVPGDYFVKVGPYWDAFTGTYSVKVSEAFQATGSVLTGEVGATITFALVGGGSEIPPPAVTLADGTWSQAGFTAGATYRATPSLAGYIFGPLFQEFNEDSTTGIDFTAYSTTSDDHGNTWDTATGIALDTNVPGVIEIPADVDFFKVNLTKNVWVTITLTKGTLPGYKLALLDPVGTTITVKTDAPITYAPPATGDYFVKVEPNGAVTGTYSVRVSTDDHGNIEGTATTIATNVDNAGIINDPLDVDYFKVTLTDEKIDVTLTPAAPPDGLTGYKMTLYQPGGATVEATDAPITGAVLSAGDYYLKVEPNGAVTGKYTVRVTQPAP